MFPPLVIPDVHRRDFLKTAPTMGVAGFSGCSQNGYQIETVKFPGGAGLSFSEALESVAKHPGSTLEIEKGSHILEPEEGLQGGYVPHFRKRDLEDVTIEGNSATLIFSDPTLAGFDIIDANDVTLRNLTFDYDPPPFTQGVIHEVQREERRLTLEIEDGFPLLDHEMFSTTPNVWASVHTEANEFIRGIRHKRDPDKHFSSIERVSNRRFALFLDDFSDMVGIQEGRKLAIVARRAFPVLRFYKVNRLILEDLTVHSSIGSVFSIQLCENPIVRNCTISPQSNSNRLIAANADGVRFINCLSQPVVENCRFEYLEDDGIVVQHTLAPVTEMIDEYTIGVAEVHPVVAKKGDIFGVMAPDGTRKTNLPAVTDIEYRYDVGSENTRGKPVSLKFDEPVDDKVSKGDLIGNLATASHEFQVRNNELRNHRARLIRISASNGIVEANTLDGSHQSAIVLESEGTLQPFAPKSWVSNVRVIGNRISRPGLNYFAGHNPAGIRVTHKSPPNVEQVARPNSDITISNNTIENAADFGLLLENARDIRTEGNTMKDLNQLEYSRFADLGIKLENISRAEVIGNTVTGTSDNIDDFGIQLASQSIEARDNELVIDGESKPAKIINLVPVLLKFNKAVKPEGGDRYLSFVLHDLELLNQDKEPILSVDVGTDETSVEFGEGVYPPEQSDDFSWRWLGGESKIASIFFSVAELAKAHYLQLWGEPFEKGIEAIVEVQGERVDSISFGPTEMQYHLIQLG